MSQCNCQLIIHNNSSQLVHTSFCLVSGVYSSGYHAVRIKIVNPFFAPAIMFALLVKFYKNKINSNYLNLDFELCTISVGE